MRMWLSKDFRYREYLTMRACLIHVRLRSAWHLACITVYLYVFLWVAYDYQLSSAMEKARFKYYNFIARICNSDRAERSIRILMQNIFDISCTNVITQPTFIIASNRERRKPENFPPDAKLSPFSYRPTSSDSSLRKGGFLIAHPGYFLMREWGQGIRVFFSVWHLVLYISELVFIYIRKLVCLQPPPPVPLFLPMTCIASYVPA